MASSDLVLVGTYDFRVVVLSVTIAILGSYAGFEFATRALAHGTARQAWLVGGAIALAVGIWSMHYTGMVAFRLPVPTLYHWPTALLSYFPALFGSIASMLLLSKRSMSSRQVLASGIAQGGGISVLHYLSMNSMRLMAMHRYAPLLVALSVLLSMSFSVVSLRMQFLWRGQVFGRNLQRAIAVLAMGAGAISGMHYTAMAAVTFTPSAAAPDLSRCVQVSSLGTLGVGAVSLLVLVAAIMTSVVDRLRQQRALLEQLFEQSPEPAALLTVDHHIVRVNREFTRVFGYAPAEVARRPLFDLVVPQEFREEVRGYAETLRRGQRVDAEGVRQRKDGTRLRMSLVHVPVSVPGEQIAVYSIYRDITDRYRAAEQLRQSREQLRALAGRIEALREEERARISRELHDELGQSLTALRTELAWVKWKLDAMGSFPSGAEILERLVSVMDLVDGMVTAVRDIASELRPSVLDHLGVGSALQYECRRFQERSGMRCELLLPDQLSLPPEISTALFRIFQECLTNVVRHAGATNVVTELSLEGDGVTMRIQDDGRGIDEQALSDPQSLGLLGMRERVAFLGGEIVFEGGAERGTTVTVRIPSSPSRWETGPRADGEDSGPG
jgi:PAS domain S-box-containing protein